MSDAHQIATAPAAGKPPMTVEEFHKISGGAYRTLIDEEVRAIIEALQVAAEIVCDCHATEADRKR